MAAEERSGDRASHPRIARERTLIEHVRLCLSEVDDLWTAITILLQNRALFAIVGVADTLAAADHTATLIAA
jgi:hypothetical protein